MAITTPLGSCCLKLETDSFWVGNNFLILPKMKVFQSFPKPGCFQKSHEEQPAATPKVPTAEGDLRRLLFGEGLLAFPSWVSVQLSHQCCPPSVGSPAPLQWGLEPAVPRSKGNVFPTKVWSWARPRPIISLLV